MSDSPSIWNRLRLLFRGNNPPSAAVPPIAPTPEAKKTPPPPPPPSALPSRPADALQVLSPPHSSVAVVPVPEVDLVLGLDLGTCCTKIVIGDPGWKNKSYAISFSPANGDISAWLHPPRFGSEANLKMRLMDNPASERVRDALACYLAEVIGKARTLFESQSTADYRRRQIRWSLNLGFPGKAVDTSPLASAYREVAKVAIALSSQAERPSIELASRIRRNEAGVEPFIPTSRIGIYPEIAAQLAGYVNSPHRRRGNLLLIDVGAGTLDVSTIILHGDEEQEIVAFHFCEVKNLGVLRLYEKRAHQLEKIENGCVSARS